MEMQRSKRILTLFDGLVEQLWAAGHEGLVLDAVALREKYEQARRDAAATKQVLPMEEPAPEGHVWRKHDRRIVAGDVVRHQVDNKDDPNYGLYRYAVAVGAGGGCDPESPRSANKVWVHSESMRLEDVLTARAARRVGHEACWSSYWGLSILEAVVTVESGESQ